ncbi:MAG: DUF790 family protein [Polyangiaceae bacterium]
MLPSALCRLSVAIEGDRIVPRYFQARDLAWLGALLDEYRALAGLRRSSLELRLQSPLPVRAPRAKLAIARHVLDGYARDRVEAALSPAEARWAVFTKAAVAHAPRAEVLAEVAAAFGVTSVELEQSLFADLRGERCVSALPPDLSARQLAAQANRAIVASLLKRALRVRVRAWEEAATVARRAHRLGLICWAPSPDWLDISGPYALFRHTGVYAQALASLLGVLAACERFELEAECVAFSAVSLRFSLSSADCIGVLEPSAAPEGSVHERFVRDFRKRVRAWDLLELAGPWASADFELALRIDPSRRTPLSILGYWTAANVRQRLQAGQIVCVDAKRCCDERPGFSHPRCVPYKSRVDVGQVLALLAGEVGEGPA